MMVIDDIKHTVSEKNNLKSIFYNDSGDLLSVIDSYRAKKCTIVQCHGVFDLLHIGHIRHFKQAKKMGDILVVSITADKYVNKGPDRPRFTETLRAEAIASLVFVDVVIINKNPTAENMISMIKPRFYVKGSEYKEIKNDLTGKILDERRIVESFSGEIIYTEDITFSSSSLLNTYMPPYPLHVMDYLKSFKKKYSAKDVMACIDAFKELKVLVIGEAIIDEYIFCNAIGKAGKEPVLVTKYSHKEQYAGGILAVANHLADFCKEVKCITYLGDRDSQKEFIQSKLKPGVTLDFTEKRNSPTIVKTRYVDEYSAQKLFEVYMINDDHFDENKQKFHSQLSDVIPNYDVVIVADYGHGLIDKQAIDILSKKSKFLAVNTQANAGNHGFNCIEKYTSADYVCIAHRELLLTLRDKTRTPEEGLQYLLSKHNYKNMMITTGVQGSLVHVKDQKLACVPAFATKVTDRVGAGDSVLSITSLAVAMNQPAEIIGLIGNMVGAQAVNIMGNKSSIEKVALKKFISHALK